MLRANRMEMGMVKTMQSTRGMEMVHIRMKLPTTVTRLVSIWITSVDRHSATTSMS